MLRRCSAVFVALYLGTLAYGLVSHAVGYKTYRHLGMYFIVWDMYCGWSGWETRTHLLGEGESGTYYELDPPPWGDICVFGDTGRRHYDATGMHALRLAQNTVAHTEHEPIVRYLVIEEAWAKKYNLPDELWALRYEAPREFRSYHRIRAAFDADGELTLGAPGWHAWLATQAVGNNPRLRKDVQRGTPVFTAGDFARDPSVVMPVGHQTYSRD
ncbi:MAG: hypothetical protein KF774_03710 [Planctomyces sp.]|nr:hypothetical protein [Planctomyces sp.]